MKCPGIMKLGLLHEAETKTITTGGQPKFVSFAHKSFQELAAAFYIEKFLQCSDDIQVRISHQRTIGRTSLLFQASKNSIK